MRTDQPRLPLDSILIYMISDGYGNRLNTNNIIFEVNLSDHRSCSIT